MGNLRTSTFFRGLCFLLAYLLVQTSVGKSYAQDTPFFAVPKQNFLDLSVAYSLPVLRGMRVHPNKPFEFDFVVDSKDRRSFALQDTSVLIKYFLTCLTVPEKDLWVNLSPYESQHIMSPELVQTDAGNDLLKQDKLLKQLSASLTYPESALGKKFWQRVYQKSREQFGTRKLAVNTYNKVWIVPDKAVVYDMGDSALIGEAHLKVMLEADYLALKNHVKVLDQDTSQGQKISAAITKEIILPELEKEVNQGKTFAPVRQVFHSMILAAWFKRALKRNVLSKFYVDHKKMAGVNTADKGAKEAIYQQYLGLYKEGAYNYIRDDVDPLSGQAQPRKYFSGGVTAGDSAMWLHALQVPDRLSAIEPFLNAAAASGDTFGEIKVALDPQGTLLATDPAMAGAFNKVMAGLGLMIGLSVAHGALADTITKYTVNSDHHVIATFKSGSSLSQMVLDIMNAQKPQLADQNRAVELYRSLDQYLAKIHMSRGQRISAEQTVDITALVEDQKAVAYLVGQAVAGQGVAAQISQVKSSPSVQVAASVVPKAVDPKVERDVRSMMDALNYKEELVTRLSIEHSAHPIAAVASQPLSKVVAVAPAVEKSPAAPAGPRLEHTAVQEQPQALKPVTEPPYEVPQSQLNTWGSQVQILPPQFFKRLGHGQL